MNFQAIFRILSFIILTLAFAFTVCGTVDIFIFDNKTNREPWLHCIEIALFIAALFFLFSIRRKLEIFRREVLAIVGLGWIALSVVGTLPYLLIAHIPFFDALFESTSGITTTGMTLFSTPENLGPGILLWRALSQWIGGLGIAVFFVIMTASMEMAAKQVFSNESSCNIADFDSGKFKNNALSLFRVYFLLTLGCFLVLLAMGMSPFDAVCHTLTTVSTGGFSTHHESIAHFHSPKIMVAIIFFMTLSGTNFVILSDLIHRFFKKIRENDKNFIHYFFASIIDLICKFYKKILENEEMRIYYALLLLNGLFVVLLLHCEGNYTSFFETCLEGFFHTISAITSCGFTACDFSHWLPSIHIILLILMVCGGCVGSTAGGIKIARIAIAVKAVFNGLIGIFRPRMIRNVSFNGKNIELTEKENVFNLCILYCFLFLLFLFIFTLMERRLDFLSAVSTVTALFSNSGMPILQAPIHPVEFSATAKVVASLIMILGRVEFYSILLLFVPAFWQRY
ncbi:MAG: TrkH family potassium uptake protein [Puniceicoccales bacterium]|jgi:trk system potassium uptake protein TrkH|nr:TrkH family potassium uptake protein [Puniceicoccales bacterium]